MNLRLRCQLVRFVLISSVFIFTGHQDAFSSVHSLSPIEVNELQVTNDPADQYDPLVSGNKVFFGDNRYGNTNLFLSIFHHDDLLDGIDGTAVNPYHESMIASAPEDELIGGFEGSSLVYTAYSSPSIVFSHDLKTSSTSYLSANAGVSNQSGAAIGGGIAAWADDRDGNFEIYLKDLSSGEESRGTITPSEDEGNISISPQGLIAFESCASGTCDIKVLDPATGIITVVAGTASDERSPDIDGNYVVFEANRDGDHDIYVFETASGVESRIALAGIQSNAHVRDNVVSFEDSSTGLTHIMIYIISTGEIFQVTKNPSNQYNHTMRLKTDDDEIEGYLAYTDDRNGNLDIFVSEFEISDEECDGIDDDLDGEVDEGYPAGNTGCGTNVRTVTDDDLELDFDHVTVSGDTTVTKAGSGPRLPKGYNPGSTPVFHDIKTTAAFAGLAKVCVPYDETHFSSERTLRLLHWNGTRWDDITVSVDRITNKVCGRTAGFSPFVIAQESSTAVTISALSAEADTDHIKLLWTTSSETDNEGFYILRSETAEGPFAKISPIIHAMGGPGMRQTYSYMDWDVDPDRQYFYKLQDVDSRGIITAHNVISAVIDMAAGKETGEAVREETAGNEDIEERRDGAAETDIWTAVVFNDSGAGTGIDESATEVIDDDREYSTGDASAAADSQYDTGHSMSAYSSSYFDRNEINRGVTGHENHKSVSAGPSSLLLSIEDGNGNTVDISRMDRLDDSIMSSDMLIIIEDMGQTVVSWTRAGHERGFVLKRSERGSNNFLPISGLIPNFGRETNDSYIYRFTDRGLKSGVEYDYQLDRISSEFEIGKR